MRAAAESHRRGPPVPVAFGLVSIGAATVLTTVDLLRLPHNGIALNELYGGRRRDDL
jgi:hypothetical protein